MPSISLPEYRLRQFVLHNILPSALSAVRRIAGLAETRIRRTLAVQRYVDGSGIEVGAAVSPSVVPNGSSIQFVDKYDKEALESDPELAGFPVPAPDIIDEAETLSTLEDNSQDFALAFSVIEHVQDPIGMIASFHRVVRDGGTIVISVPDKRKSGDRNRQLTTLEHLIRDHEEGPEVSREQHLFEVAEDRGLEGAEAEAYVREKIDTDGHTHFHVWSADTFLEFVLAVREYKSIPFEVLEYGVYGHEALIALRVRKGDMDVIHEPW